VSGDNWILAQKRKDTEKTDREGAEGLKREE
jgi:hypothetical protein